MVRSHFDVLIVGSGPAGQEAAREAARAGRKVLVVEREEALGGAGLRRGVIPLQLLREMAAALVALERRTGETIQRGAHIRVAGLLQRRGAVVRAHEHAVQDELRHGHVDRWHGRARFVAAHELEVERVDGPSQRVRADAIVLAVGARPHLGTLPLDHEHLLDTDSILSMLELPKSITVLGAEVIGSEYASILAALGVRVTLVDAAERPCAFLDRELGEEFVTSFTDAGGRFIGGATVRSAAWDGFAEVVTTLDDGQEIRSEKLFAALGRVANVDGLGLEAAGLAPSPSGHIEVDASGQTAVPGLYAVGEAAGTLPIATLAIDGARRAVRHALGLESSASPVPIGVFTLPEMATVGIDAAQADGGKVGRVRFAELVRGQLGAASAGLLKLVSDAAGRRILGVQIVGDGAADLLLAGQLAIAGGLEVDTLAASVISLPTLGEAYRLAARDIIKQRSA